MAKKKKIQKWIYKKLKKKNEVFYEIVDFFVFDMCSKPIFCSKVAQKGKICSWLLEPQKGCSKRLKLLKRCRAESGKASSECRLPHAIPCSQMYFNVTFEHFLASNCLLYFSTTKQYHPWLPWSSPLTMLGFWVRQSKSVWNQQ